MFKLQPNPSFKSKVELSVPGNKPAAVDIEFKHLSKKAIKGFFEGMADKADVDALGEIIVGWSGIDAPYSEEALAELLDNYPASAGEIFEAFRRDLLEARRKN